MWKISKGIVARYRFFILEACVDSLFVFLCQVKQHLSQHINMCVSWWHLCKMSTRSFRGTESPSLIHTKVTVPPAVHLYNMHSTFLMTSPAIETISTLHCKVHTHLDDEAILL